MQDFFPAAVIAAIILFGLRELFELIRRRGADARKLSAIKAATARECELNNYTIARVGSAVRSLAEAVELEADGYSTKIIQDRFNEEFFCQTGPAGDSSWPVPKTHRQFMDRHFVEVAGLDKKFFETFHEGYDAVAEIEHVRKGLIQYADPTTEDDRLHRDAFPDYALRELDDAAKLLTKLYKACTGKDQIPSRLR